MCAVLDSRRVRNYAVDGGGDVGTIGCKSAGPPRTVAVQDPHGGLRPDVLHLQDAAVATSGNYERWFDAERRYLHIVDPGTGLSPSD